MPEVLPEFDIVIQHNVRSSTLSMLDQNLQGLQIGLLQEMATKWCLNAITTGAHILKGKVYRNIMIDVKVR